jgi:hypothetical protein
VTTRQVTLVLVAHSNAGLFIPSASGAVPVVPPELLALLRDKASGGLLPRWTDWWDEAEVAALFPDQATRQMVTEEEPTLPLAYYEASVPCPLDGMPNNRAPTCCLGRPMTSWLARRAGGAGSSNSFQAGICTSWWTLMVSPDRC